MIQWCKDVDFMANKNYGTEVQLGFGKKAASHTGSFSVNDAKMSLAWEYYEGKKVKIDQLK